MSGWVAVVPRKVSGLAKSRLAGVLGEQARATLVDAMGAHVLDVVAEVERVTSMMILGAPVSRAPQVTVLPDGGRGLNAELVGVRASLAGQSILIVHADLPLLTRTEVETLLNAAENQGAALAPDRHGRGTNALALSPHIPFTFAFGPGSLARHRAQAPPDLQIVSLPGLALDVDEPADLHLAAAAGAASCRDALASTGITPHAVGLDVGP
jgi:2-phospho-L-lactate guanylyltransferase